MSKSLGRGLSSLIPKKTVSLGQSSFSGATTTGELLVVDDRDRVLRISPERISINPLQPRTTFSEASLKDLADSIREHGIIQPLIVTKKKDGFELIAGERRLRSAKLLGLKKVPVLVRQEKQQKKLELALIENLQREDLNPLENARAYQRLIDEFNITQEEAAQRLGKARSSIANSLRLLSLPTEIQEALITEKITAAHAKYLLGIDNPAKQLNIFKKIIRQNLSVAQTNQEIKRLGGTKAAQVKTYFDRTEEKRLSSILDTKVELRRRGSGGKIIIDFYNGEQLQEIIKKIQQLEDNQKL